MFKLVRHLSQELMQELIRERCSHFGSVRAVDIAKDDERYDFALAGVAMSAESEAKEVLRAFGDLTVGAMVVIRIE